MAAPERDGIVDWSRVIVAIVDDSEQRATQQALEELADWKEQFIAAVGHELGTPLTAVIGFADELRPGVHEPPVEEQHNLLDLIVSWGATWRTGGSTIAPCSLSCSRPCRSRPQAGFLGDFQDLFTPQSWRRVHHDDMTDPITGRRPTGRRRAPKSLNEQRVCSHRGCDTQLSRYNRKMTCHVHSPIKFPRVRGREAPSPT
jgi:hypothetical protein